MGKKTEYNMPAFPQSEPYTSQEGMTLLDYMAAKAMQGYLANTDNTTEFRRMGLSNETEYGVVSMSAYRQAAAMLEERKKYIQ